MRIVEPLPTSFLRSRETKASSALSPRCSSNDDSFSERPRLLTTRPGGRHQLDQHGVLARRQVHPEALFAGDHEEAPGDAIEAQAAHFGQRFHAALARRTSARSRAASSPSSNGLPR